jgi:hypothetical protein
VKTIGTVETDRNLTSVYCRNMDFEKVCVYHVDFKYVRGLVLYLSSDKNIYIAGITNLIVVALSSFAGLSASIRI